jgi:hypothetical protein
VLLGEVVPDGDVVPGILLEGILLGGNVLGVALPVLGVVPGAHGPATVADVPVVPVALGVELPIVVDGVLPTLPLLVVLVPVLVVPVVLVPALAVPLGTQVPVVVAVVPLGVVVDWLGVVVVEVLGFVVVDWLGVVVEDWLGVVVVVCEGVTPVALEVPVVADGLVWVADGVVCVLEGIPVVAVPPEAVDVLPVVPVLAGAPVVCAAATPMASMSMKDAHKVLFIEIAPWPGLIGRSFCSLAIRFFPSGMPSGAGEMASVGPGALLPYNDRRLNLQDALAFEGAAVCEP